MHSRGFPNCFIMSPRRPASPSTSRTCSTSRAGTSPTSSRRRSSAARARVEVSEAAETRLGRTPCIQLAGFGREFFESCTPGYYNNEGKLSERAAQNGFYGGGSIEFFRILKEWREKGGMEGLEVG